MTESISFDGNAMGAVQPNIDAYANRVVEVGSSLVHAFESNTFDGTDELSHQAHLETAKVIQIVSAVFMHLGEAVGVQNERLGAVRALGELTEGTAESLAHGWSGPAGHRG